MKLQIPLLAAALVASTSVGHSAVLFSTGWDNPTSTTTDGVGMNGSPQGVAITGGGNNTAAPAGFWTVTNSAVVDLSSSTLFTDGTNTVGAVSGNDILRKGAVLTTGTDYSYTIGLNNSAIRYALGTGVWAPQFNAAGVNDGRFNVLFEIKPTNTLDSWSVSLRYGTASTTGGWNNNTAAQNGSVDIDIYSVAGDGTLALTGVTFASQSLSGAGPTATLNALNSASSLSAGNYLLSIALTGKTLNQRYTIDDLSVSAVPEPSVVLLVMVALGVLISYRRVIRRGIVS